MTTKTDGPAGVMVECQACGDYDDCRCTIPDGRGGWLLVCSRCWRDSFTVLIVRAGGDR